MGYESMGQILAAKRKEKQLSQPKVAAKMCEKGMPTKTSAISKWEKGVNTPNTIQFFTLCDILGITDINKDFGVALKDNLFYQLNDEGQKKAYEYMDLLIRSGMYVKETISYSAERRNIRIYDLPVSAGPGQFLDSDNYSMIQVGDEVPSAAEFGVRVSGDSMEPAYQDHQVVWIHRQQTLEEGDIGIFYLDGSAYIKKFHLGTDGISLVSLNRLYPPIMVPENADFRIYGHVIG